MFLWRKKDINKNSYEKSLMGWQCNLLIDTACWLFLFIFFFKTSFYNQTAKHAIIYFLQTDSENISSNSAIRISASIIFSIHIANIEKQITKTKTWNSRLSGKRQEWLTFLLYFLLLFSFSVFAFIPKYETT